MQVILKHQFSRTSGRIRIMIQIRVINSDPDTAK